MPSLQLRPGEFRLSDQDKLDAEALRSLDPNDATTAERFHSIVDQLPDTLSQVAHLLGDLTLLSSAAVARRRPNTTPAPITASVRPTRPLWLASQFEGSHTIDPSWAPLLLDELPFIGLAGAAEILGVTPQMVPSRVNAVPEHGPIVYYESGYRHPVKFPLWIPQQFV